MRARAVCQPARSWDRLRASERVRQGRGERTDGSETIRDGLASMCGVTVDGKPIKDTCTVEGVAHAVEGMSILWAAGRIRTAPAD